MTRAVALFVVAAGLVAAVAWSQDDSSALVERIDRLADELEGRLEARRKATEGLQPVPVTYEVGDICAFSRDETSDPLRLYTSEGPVAEPPRQDTARQRFEPDFLIEMMRAVVCPDAWGSGTWLSVEGDRVTVNQLPHVQKGIAALLDRIRAVASMQVAVDIVAVAVDPGAAELGLSRPRELSPDVAARMLKGEPLGRVRIVCRDSQQAVQRGGRSVAYVADRDVRAAADGGGALPVHADLFVGCAAQVRVSLDLGGGGAVLHGRLELTGVEDPVRRADTPAGGVDLPVLRLTRVDTSLWVPLDRTVVVGGGAVAGRGCLFLATVRAIRPGK